MGNEARERDLVLAPYEYAYVQDLTKGNVSVCTGGNKVTLEETDAPVIFNDESKRFERARAVERAIQVFKIAPEGWYMVLKNPAVSDIHPESGRKVMDLPELVAGKKINIPGPMSFALWPGQMVKVVKGHHLRSNQYLVVRVYEEEAAKENWPKAVVKLSKEAEGQDELPAVVVTGDMPDFTMGKLFVIKGTEVSFYIPPTGVEVVMEKGQYVREAVTLERLEYCILRDEDGNKRYMQGPDVVFPTPTETFITDKSGEVKFRAIELNEISGLYIKVIAPYSDDDGEYEVGDELFITGKDQMIYFPREEHAIIKYGTANRHFATAVPAGEARYVLDRMSGKIEVVEGPEMLLPDPRKRVIVRRALDPKLVSLWFPGNREALLYNQELHAMMSKASREGDYVSENEYLTKSGLLDDDVSDFRGDVDGAVVRAASGEFVGDQVERKTGYTQPRTLTLNTKYEGTIDVEPYTGYAVLVVSKAGGRRVVVGPKTIHLEYDEFLEAMELSTETPKSDEKTIRTVYLRVLNNKISDKVTAETKDLCEIDIWLSFRVNFEGDPERWFNVENYVKFLTDHLRSLIRNLVKQHGIEDFYSDSISIIRDGILGVPSEAEEGGVSVGRSGKTFLENGMKVYDVEILDVRIGDEEIADMLVTNQNEIVQQALNSAKRRRDLEVTKEIEEEKRKSGEYANITEEYLVGLSISEVKKSGELDQERINQREELEKRKQELVTEEQKRTDMVHKAELSRERESDEYRLDVETKEQDLRIAGVVAEANEFVKRAEAIPDKLIAALQSFSDADVLAKASESLGPMAILGGKSVADIVNQMFKGTKLEGSLLRNFRPGESA